MYLYLSLLALMSVFFYFTPLNVAVLFYCGLIALSVFIKYKALRMLRWLVIIQLACALTLNLQFWQQYGIGTGLISLFIFVFFFLLTMPVDEEETQPQPVIFSPAPQLTESISSPQITVTDKRSNSHFYHNDVFYINGYAINPVFGMSSPDHHGSKSGNEALLQQLHTATHACSQLAGQVIPHTELPGFFAETMYAFYHDEKGIYGLQSGELSLIFSAHHFHALRIIENTCRGADWYELALETRTKRIFFHHLSGNSPAALYQQAIRLTSIWKISLKTSHINHN